MKELRSKIEASKGKTQGDKYTGHEKAKVNTLKEMLIHSADPRHTGPEVVNNSLANIPS